MGNCRGKRKRKSWDSSTEDLSPFAKQSISTMALAGDVPILDPYGVMRRRNCKTNTFSRRETYPSIRPPVSRCSHSQTLEWLNKSLEQDGCCDPKRVNDALKIWESSPRKDTLSYYGVGNLIDRPEAKDFNRAVRSSLQHCSINKSRGPRRKTLRQAASLPLKPPKPAPVCQPYILNPLALQAELQRMPTVKQKLRPSEAFSTLLCKTPIDPRDPLGVMAARSKAREMVSLNKVLAMEKLAKPRKNALRRNQWNCPPKCGESENDCTDYEWAKYKLHSRLYDEAFQREMAAQKAMKEAEPRNYNELYKRFQACFEVRPEPDPECMAMAQCCPEIHMEGGGSAGDGGVGGSAGDGACGGNTDNGAGGDCGAGHGGVHGDGKCHKADGSSRGSSYRDRLKSNRDQDRDKNKDKNKDKDKNTDKNKDKDKDKDMDKDKDKDKNTHKDTDMDTVNGKDQDKDKDKDMDKDKEKDKDKGKYKGKDKGKGKGKDMNMDMYLDKDKAKNNMDLKLFKELFDDKTTLDEEVRPSDQKSANEETSFPGYSWITRRKEQPKKPQRKRKKSKSMDKKKSPVSDTNQDRCPPCPPVDCPCGICKVLNAKPVEDKPFMKTLLREQKDRELREYLRTMRHRQYLECGGPKCEVPPHRVDPISCDDCFYRNPKLAEYCDCLGALQRLHRLMAKYRPSMVNQEMISDLRNRVARRLCECIEG